MACGGSKTRTGTLDDSSHPLSLNPGAPANALHPPDPWRLRLHRDRLRVRKSVHDECHCREAGDRVSRIEHQARQQLPTVRRARPVVLTALAAILAMIPLSRSAFWGPMAVTIMGGLFVATLLTLLFLPALYALAFRRRLNQRAEPRAEAGVALAQDNDGVAIEAPVMAPKPFIGPMLPAGAAANADDGQMALPLPKPPQLAAE